MEIQPQHIDLDTLFHRRLFRIPQYQRAYSWQTKHRRALFDDILRSYSSGNGQNHFMATVVGLRQDKRKILTDEYQVIDVVDGQQRMTTLVLLYKAIAKALDRSDEIEESVGEEVDKVLVKPDDVCPVLLQTNHDSSGLFMKYLRTGELEEPSRAKTLAEKELLLAMGECERFVENWKSDGETLADLVSHLKNKLTFILHEIDDESLVYTVFEVLNSRGLDVSWFDRLKSMLMAVVFETETGNEREMINEVHKLWSEIYRTIGLRLGLSTESLRFAATLRSTTCPNRVLNEEDAARVMLELTERTTDGVIEVSRWLKTVTEVVDELTGQARINAITRISHARLLAVAVKLNANFDEEQKAEVLHRWESVTFRIFGMHSRDARTKVGDFVRLAWRLSNESPKCEEVLEVLSEIGQDYPIGGAVKELRKVDCYNGWREELRYLLYRYEEDMAEKKGQTFDNEQWNRIWEASAADSIEHVRPQSSRKKYMHWLGNLILLPPGLNSELGDCAPDEKVEAYRDTGLFLAVSVARSIEKSGRWGKSGVIAREKKLLKWARKRWAD